MKHLQLVIKYIVYFFKSVGKHGVHSPFVFEFITKVLNDKRNYSDYKEVERTRKQLTQNKTAISLTDFGAGSKSKRQTISDVVRSSSKLTKYGRLLYRIARYYKPKNILELGTSAGISTLYFSQANPAATVITIEGSPEIANIAKESLQTTQAENVKLVVGKFEDKIIPALQQLKSVDLIFFDGNHRYDPTLHYFKQALNFKNPNSIFIFDDIRWSGEMIAAWEEIKQHPEVTLTIDLFFMGLVFFRKEQQVKQHFLIRY